MELKLSEHFTYKKLILYVLPCVAMMILTSVYGIVDGFFVSNYAGKNAFAAVNLIMPVLMGVSSLGFMIEHVQEKADFLLSNMAFFFVPAGVSIINYFDELKSTAVQLIIICIISTVVTFAVTAYSVMLTVRLMKKWKDRRKKA